MMTSIDGERTIASVSEYATPGTILSSVCYPCPKGTKGRQFVLLLHRAPFGHCEGERQSRSEGNTLASGTVQLSPVFRARNASIVSPTFFVSSSALVPTLVYHSFHYRPNPMPLIFPCQSDSRPSIIAFRVFDTKHYPLCSFPFVSPFVNPLPQVFGKLHGLLSQGYLVGFACATNSTV